MIQYSTDDDYQLYQQALMNESSGSSGSGGSSFLSDIGSLIGAASTATGNILGVVNKPSTGQTNKLTQAQLLAQQQQQASQTRMLVIIGAAVVAVIGLILFLRR